MTRPLSIITTEDGTTIIVDPDIGAVTGKSRAAAEAKIRRRKAQKEAA